MTDSIVNPEHSVTGEALEEESTSSIVGLKEGKRKNRFIK